MAVLAGSILALFKLSAEEFEQLKKKSEYKKPCLGSFPEAGFFISIKNVCFDNIRNGTGL